MAYIELFERKGVAANMYLRKFLVSSESDLASLPKDCAPGSVVHTSGYVNRWELGIDGVWTKIPEGSSVDVSYMLDSDDGLPYIQEV